MCFGGKGRISETERIIGFRSIGTSLVVQWFRLHLPMRGGTGSIPGQGAKFPHTSQQEKQNKT